MKKPMHPGDLLMKANAKKSHEKKSAPKKNWIAGAIKKPGALHAELGIKKGSKIPVKTLAHAATKGGKVGRRARLAETLKGFKHKTKEMGHMHKHAMKAMEHVAKHAMHEIEHLHKEHSKTVEHMMKSHAHKSESYGFAPNTDMTTANMNKKHAMKKHAEKKHEMKKCAKCGSMAHKTHEHKGHAKK